MRTLVRRHSKPLFTRVITPLSGLGDGDGAVVVDLVKFQKFEMNRETWRATVGSGTLLGDLTTRMHNAGGRAMAHGTCPQVGIGGERVALCSIKPNLTDDAGRSCDHWWTWAYVEDVGFCTGPC